MPPEPFVEAVREGRGAVVEDRAVPADDIGNPGADQPHRERGRGRALGGPAGRQEHQRRAAFAEGGHEVGGPRLALEALRILQHERRLAVPNGAVAGEVQSLDRPFGGEARHQKVETAALLDPKVQRQPLGRAEDAGLLAVMVEPGRTLGLRRHEHQEQIAVGRLQGDVRLAQPARQDEGPLGISGEKVCTVREQFPGHVEKGLAGLVRRRAGRKLQAPFAGPPRQRTEPAAAPVQPAVELLAEPEQAVGMVGGHHGVIALRPVPKPVRIARGQRPVPGSVAVGMIDQFLIAIGNSHGRPSNQRATRPQ